jgi:hypothetical protein
LNQINKKSCFEKKRAAKFVGGTSEPRESAGRSLACVDGRTLREMPGEPLDGVPQVGIRNDDRIEERVERDASAIERQLMYAAKSPCMVNEKANLPFGCRLPVVVLKHGNAIVLRLFGVAAVSGLNYDCVRNFGVAGEWLKWACSFFLECFPD